MKQLKKLSLTLLLLITAAAGAWADGTYTVTFKANGNTKTVENVTLPKTFSCNYDKETGRGTDELDLIIQELYGLSEGRCETQAPNSDNASVTCALDGASNQFIIVSTPFNGTATVTGWYLDSNYNGIKYTLEITCAEPPFEVTTNAASEQDLFTTASFKMPASDVTVSYTLVRDMNDTENPVTFSGLPTGNIAVKKGSNSKYQPAAALTIQLNDALISGDNKNIIDATDLTVTVEKKGDGDTWTSGTLTDFLADMQPGTYRLTATPKDETSSYDGTVTSGEFTVVEQYDLTVKPADDYSKGKVESVTVGTEQPITPDANGEATKTGIAPNTDVKIKAKHGYIIEKVEVNTKKTGGLK